MTPAVMKAIEQRLELLYDMKESEKTDIKGISNEIETFKSILKEREYEKIKHSYELKWLENEINELETLLKENGTCIM